ncbi:MAG: pyridoxamine 5'-phosphate oxidase family protein [bacterium]
MKKLGSTKRTRIRRSPTRTVAERRVLHEIIDTCYVCHVGFIDQGHPFVIPTLGWRVDETLFIHGSRGSRMLKVINAGGDVCITFTILDGLVMARSPFHHSANYRSAVVLGKPALLQTREEKLDSMEVFMENISPGRWPELRETNSQEIEATDVLALPLDEASVKMRTGGPIDDDEDMSLPIWSGVIPVKQFIGPTMIADKDNLDGVETPDYSAAFGNRWGE